MLNVLADPVEDVGLLSGLKAIWKTYFRIRIRILGFLPCLVTYGKRSWRHGRKCWTSFSFGTYSNLGRHFRMLNSLSSLVILDELLGDLHEYIESLQIYISTYLYIIYISISFYSIFSFSCQYSAMRLGFAIKKKQKKEFYIWSISVK